ncbi:MAG: cyclase family protein [Desulfurococcales archaeon]|nr:cyclase family protein [Desulfurococcales archaeon]MEB3789120.1 cyclase family protein [Desulfurococcales archaeon]
MLENCKVIDLTNPLGPDTPVFPGDPPPTFPSLASYNVHGYHLRQIKVTEHTGTHIDAPRHFFATGQGIDQVPLHELIGRVQVLDLSSFDKITRRVLEKHINGNPPMLAVYTGYRWNHEDPCIDVREFTVDAAWFLVEKGTRVLLLDAPSPDCHPYEVHRILLGNNVYIVENVAGLEKIIDGEPYIIVAPLKLVNGTGSPARVFALQCDNGT